MYSRARTSGRPPHGGAAFTLLEVMIGVAIISMIVISIYRFVETNLTAIGLSMSASEERALIVGFSQFVEGQMADLPPQTPGALTGRANKFKDLPSDEMDWICRAGQGVLTTAAPDTYRVTLALQPISSTSSKLEIGLRRRLIDAEDRNYQWLPLIPDVAALEIRYFDKRLNAWLERWQEQNSLPSLIRLRLWREGDELPFETVISVPAARLQTL